MKQVTAGELRDVLDSFDDETIIYIQRLRDKDTKDLEILLEGGREFIPVLNIGRNIDGEELFLLWEEVKY